MLEVKLSIKLIKLLLMKHANLKVKVQWSWSSFHSRISVSNSGLTRFIKATQAESHNLAESVTGITHININAFYPVVNRVVKAVTWWTLLLKFALATHLVCTVCGVKWQYSTWVSGVWVNTTWYGRRVLHSIPLILSSCLIYSNGGAVIKGSFPVSQQIFPTKQLSDFGCWAVTWWRLNRGQQNSRRSQIRTFTAPLLLAGVSWCWTPVQMERASLTLCVVILA